MWQALLYVALFDPVDRCMARYGVRSMNMRVDLHHTTGTSQSYISFQRRLRSREWENLTDPTVITRHELGIAVEQGGLF